jgi:formate--tetrahydrofolate ligase
MVLGFRPGKGPFVVDDLGITGALMSLLRDAIMPNLVQTQEGTPALVHGGPFANIAHGCNSRIATRMASRLADWVVTEAGFGADLGAEKFFHLKCPGTDINPSAVVVVATLRALKMHGGVALKQVAEPNAEAIRRGFCNLEKHLDNIAAFGKPTVVCLNRFPTDGDDEIELLRSLCAELGVEFADSDHFARGGAGAETLARAVMAKAQATPSSLIGHYQASDPLKTKVEAVATNVYGASSVQWSPKAEGDLRRMKRLGFGSLPVCMCKTQYSLSDDPKRLGRPTDFVISISRLELAAGAGFVVALTGDVSRMPGLPRRPAALDVDIVDGKIHGIG